MAELDAAISLLCMPGSMADRASSDGTPFYAGVGKGLPPASRGTAEAPGLG